MSRQVAVQRRSRPALVAATVVCLGVLVAPAGFALILARNLDDVPPALMWLLVLGVSLLGIIPVAAGSVIVATPTEVEGSLRPRIKALVTGIVVAGILGVLILSLGGWAAGLPAGVGVAIIAGSVTLTALSIQAASIVRALVWTARLPSSTALKRDDAVRNVRNIAFACSVALAGALAGLALLESMTGEQLSLAAVAIAVSVACMTGSVAAFLAYRPLLFGLRGLFSGDRALQKKVTSVVLKGRRLPLDEPETLVAARFAVSAASYLPFQLAQNIFLLVGLGALRLSDLAVGTSDLVLIDTVFLIALTIVLAVFTPLSLRQIHNARRFRDTQAEA